MPDSKTDNFEEKCLELITNAPACHSRHCFKSALHHLERAEVLAPIDPAMAIFRAITAEEEAASGILRCLRELQYPRSNEINMHDHRHKHAVYPFMEIVGLFFGQTIGKLIHNYQLHIKDEDGATRLMLALPIEVFGRPKLAYPIPPLNIGVSGDGMEPYLDYSSQMSEFVETKGKESIEKLIKEKANLRNRILYAGPDGYPVVQELNINFLPEKRRRVLAMAKLYLLIYPYKEHQPYVCQALDVFISILGRLKRD